MEPRREGETAFPDLGTITSRTRAVKAERIAQTRQKQRELQEAKNFWQWVDDRIADGETEADVLANAYRRAPWMKGAKRP
jgi:hypothetical protein